MIKNKGPMTNRWVGVAGRAAIVLLFAALVWLASTQIKSGSAPPTVKIGLIAPFEGYYRSTGYEALFAVKLALQERNQGRGINGYRVELVALNDFNDPAEAYRQAQALVADPDIVGVVGHFSSEATLAAMPVYQEAGLAMAIPWSVDASALNDNAHGVVSVAATLDETVARLETVSRDMGFERLETLAEVDIEAIPHDAQAVRLATDAVTAGNIMSALQKSKISIPVFGHVDTGNRQLIQVTGAAANGLIFVSPGPAAPDTLADQAFIEAYQTMAGLPPGPRAALAYDATNVLLDSIEQAMIISSKWFNNPPSRAEISAIIVGIQRQGITGQIAFDTYGRRLDAPVWVYQISEMRYPGIKIAP